MTGDTSSESGRPPLPYRWALWAVTAVVLISGVAAAAMFRAVEQPATGLTGLALDVELAVPDAVIRTASLSALLRDVTKVPIANELFGEDLAFYYESNPDRLNLEGTLRRIAYEHELTLTDRLVATAFDQPADVLLWRGAKGALEHWALAMTRGAVASFLQNTALASASGRDRQLSVAGRLALPEGGSEPVYAVEYAPERTLLLTTRGERVVVLSHPGLLLDNSGALRPDASATVLQLLAADAREQTRVYEPTFPATPALATGGTGVTHLIEARLHLLSFGYQRYFPAFEAVRFTFATGAWASALLVQPSAPNAAAAGDPRVWRAAPANAALCAALPVDWARGQSLAGSAGAALDVAAELDGPAAVCWYPDERVFAPLVVATVRSPRPALTEPVTALFDWGVKKGSGDAVAAPVQVDGATRWTRERQVPFRKKDDSTGAPSPGPLQVTLAITGSYALFSPDAGQVTRAIDTIARRYPSMADTLPADGALAVVDARRLSALVRQEALMMLPADKEPTLRAAADLHLLPRLARTEQLPAYRVPVPVVSGLERQWQPLTWQALPR